MILTADESRAKGEVIEGSPCDCGCRLWAIVSRNGEQMRLRCIRCGERVEVEGR